MGEVSTEDSNGDGNAELPRVIVGIVALPGGERRRRADFWRPHRDHPSG